MRKFDVFDNFGNKVGEFTEGAGSGAGILLLLGFVVVFGIGWMIYQFLKLITLGFDAACKGEWNKALKFWLLPSIPILLLCVGMGIDAERQSQEEQAKQSARETISEFTSDPKVVTIEKVKGNIHCLQAFGRVNGCVPPDYYFFVGKYKLTNNTDISLLVTYTSGDEEDCEKSFGHPVSEWLPPGQSMFFYCIENIGTSRTFYSNISAIEIQAWDPDGHWPNPILARFLIDGPSGKVSPNY